MTTQKQFFQEAKKRGKTKNEAMSAYDGLVKKGYVFDDLKPVRGDVSARSYSTPPKPPETERARLRKERFQKKPKWKQAVLGVGMTSYNLLNSPIKQATGFLTGGKEGFQEARQEARDINEAYQESSEGSFPAWAGEFGADVAYTAAPAGIGSKISKLRKAPGIVKNVLTGLGAGFGSSGVHALEQQGAGEKFSPWGPLVETGVSGVLPGAGGLVGKGLKKWAPGMLRSSVKPARPLMESVNPPNFVKPLEDKLITRFGGLEEGVANTSKVIKSLAEKRDNLIKNQDITVNITDATRKVGKKLNQMVKNAEIDMDDAHGAASHSKGALKTAKKIGRGKTVGKVSNKGKVWDSYKGKEDDLYNEALEDETRKLAVESFKDMATAGPYSKDIQKMANYVKNNGDKVNKKTGMLNSEHIPKSVFGESSDEIASNVGLDESEFMELLSNMVQGQKPKTGLFPSSKGKKIFNKVSVSGEDAVKIRKLADKNSKFNPFKGPTQNPDKVVFSEAYRRVIEDEIESNIAKKSGRTVSNQYKALKKEMADLIPFKKAGEFRLAQLGNNYQFSLMDMGSMGVAGSLGGLPAATAGFGIRRLTQTPGGARMLHDLGSTLTKPQTGLSGLGMQLGRSSAYGPQRER